MTEGTTATGLLTATIAVFAHNVEDYTITGAVGAVAAGLGAAALVTTSRGTSRETIARIVAAEPVVSDSVQPVASEFVASSSVPVLETKGPGAIVLQFPQTNNGAVDV